MSEVLSQNEIDALLSALNSGEIDVQEIKEEKEERKVRDYNFKIPNKFAKDHTRTLQIMHENYSRLLQTYLSGYLRALVQIEVISVDQLTYNEFTNSMPNPSVLGIVEFAPLTGSIIVEMTPTISFAMIERILGGAGHAFERVRGFTEIELSLLEKIIGQIINFFKDPWKNVIELRPRLKKIETNPQFAQILSPNETVALITLNTKIGSIEGMIHICIPHLVIEPVIPKLSTKFWFSGITKEITGSDLKIIEKKIQSTLLPIRVVLGDSEITVRDFLELGAGDVIQLNTSVNDDLKIYVGNLKKFSGKPGLKKNKVSVKITRIEKKGDDYDE
ncbi:MAG TPA: flagellar motor switch protein FliM [Bacillota bacterium]|nr:flagellar motor switch protein FliM [Clostridiaceae bacterium]HNR04468.1 flagellar motor switch protein FliM [Bacillota bacterium]HNT02293.1 flagellar motor switch protein FliM [Bacillota bacterium]HPX68160.1 flagellar motor switch protein FliM [Bacillota bacterium]HQA64536.1 flagellar motor switch protein FliM [Bacillota bacterium]